MDREAAVYWIPAFAGMTSEFVARFADKRHHHPNHSGLRGSSTALTFSSLMVPLAMRSLRSPSVGPETFERYRSTFSVPRWSFSVQVEGLQRASMPAGTQSFFW